MSNAVATTNDTAIEKVMLEGDLSKLSAAERVNYYNSLCNYLGLNPVTQPFKILRLQGRDVLYATKDATEQLRKMNGVSIERKESERVDDVYVVTVYGRDKTGRTDMATGAVTIGDAKGDKLANMLMKAETKAKRRFTLSICGLGVLDETEIETIPGEKSVSPVDEPGPTEDETQALCTELKRELENAKLDELITPDEYQKAAAGVEKRCRDYQALTEYAQKLRSRLAEVWAQHEQDDAKPEEKPVSEPKQQEMIDDGEYPII